MTGDRDSFQLVADPYVRVLYNKRGVSDYSLYDEAGILERTGVPPSQYVLLAALRGDPSDNLPGVPGVGEKTAAKLLTKYGDLDGIFGHLDEQTPKLRENLAANEELARSNARIIPLVRDVPLRGRRGPPDAGRVGPGHGRGHLRAVRDEDGLAAHGGAPRCRCAGRAGRRQCGPRPRRRPTWSGRSRAAPRRHPPRRRSSCARSRSGTTAGEITKLLGGLGSGRPRPGGPLERHARAQRPGRARPRGDGGRRGGTRCAGTGRPARALPRWPRSSTASSATQSWATTSKRSCGRFCPSASTSPASRWTPR